MGCIFSQPNKVNPVDEETYRKAVEKNSKTEQTIKNNQEKKRNGVSKEERAILEKLREEGLLSGPACHSTGGVSFQIVQADPVRCSRPPARLEQLQHKQANYSQEEIKAKLARAEARRKEREEKQVTKLHLESQIKTDAVERIRQRKKENEQMMERRKESVEEKREKKLQEIRDRMKERQRYREEVRRRKAGNKDEQ